MTQIPTSNISFSGINTALGTPFPGTITLGPNNIIRRLAGNNALLNTTTPISTADLAGKVVLANFAGPASVTVANQGNRTNPVFAEAVVTFQSDMVSVVPQWQAAVLTDINGNITPGDVTVQPLTDRSARIRLRNDSNIPSTKAGTIRVTLSLVAPNALVGNGVTTDFVIRQETLDIPMSAQVLDSGLVVAGETNVVVADFNETRAATTLVASSTVVSNPTFTFNVTRVSGSTATITQSPSTISFELRQSDIGTTTAVYDVDVTMFSSTGVRIINQIQRVTLTATRNLASMLLTANTDSASVFANNATFNVFAGLSATFPSLGGTTINWTVQGAGGATLQTATINSSSASANLSVAVNSGTFALFRDSYTVRAEQRYANGSVVTANSVNVTLRGGNIGHNYAPPSSISVSGYQAQTAIATGAATVAAAAASLSWRHVLVSGVAATIASTPNSTTLTLPASTRGTSRGATYTVSSVVTFDGQEIAQRSSSLIMAAAFNDYTFTVTAAASNTTVVASGPATATIITSVAQNIPGGTIVWTTNRVGGLTSSNTTTATNTLTVANAQSSQQTYDVTATLRDDLGRNVESTTLTQQLRAGSIALVLTGPSSISNTGVGERTFNAAYTATVGVGSQVTLNATRLSGDTFTVVGTNPITISGATSFQTQSRSGSYRITATPTLFGVVGTSQTFDASYSITQTSSGATIAVANGATSDYTATVSSTGTATVTAPVGFTVQWTGSVTGGTATPSGNVLSVVASRSSYGTSVAQATYTAAIIASNGTPTGETFNVVVTASATRLDPMLTLTDGGSKNNEGFTPITSFSDVTATFAAPGATVSFSTATLNNSSPSTVESIASGVKLQLSSNRQILSSSTRVTATLRLGGQVIATTERDVFLFAGSYFLDVSSGASVPGSSFAPQSATGLQQFSASTNFPNAAITWSSTGGGTLSAVGASATMSVTRTTAGTTSASGNITASILAAAASQSVGYSVTTTVQAALAVSLAPQTLNVNSDVTNPTGLSSFTPSITGGSPPYTVSWSGSGAGFTFGAGTASSAVARFSRLTRSGTITVNVTDSGGRTASASAAVSHVYDYITIPINIGTDGGVFVADTTVAGASLTTALAPSIAGGNGTTTSVWSVIANPGSLGFSNGVVTSSAVRYQQRSGSITARLTVTDQAGQSATRDFSVTHTYAATVPNLTATLDTSNSFRKSEPLGTASGTATIVAVVTSGVGPYTYAWTYGAISSAAIGAATFSVGSSLTTNTASLTGSTNRELEISVNASCLITDSLNRTTTVSGSMAVSLWNRSFPRA